MKLTFRLKGGPGSGFHGHSGIPGHQGGSLSNGSHPHVKFLSSPSDVKLNYEHRYAYFITANDDIVDLEGKTHVGFIYEKEQYPDELEKVFGINPINAYLPFELLPGILKNGALRVIWPKDRNEVDVQIFKIDVNSIRNIKRLIRLGKLPIANKYYIDGTIDPDTGCPRGLNISFTLSYEELMHNAMTPEIIANL